ITTTYSVTGTALSGCATNVAAIVHSVSACTGITSGLADSDIRMYPNPAIGGKATIAGLSGSNTITVFNVLGQAVITKITDEEVVTIDLSSHPNGNYLVKITSSDNQSRTVKLI